MHRRNRYLIALLLLILVSALFGYLWRDEQPAPPTLPAHSYAKRCARPMTANPALRACCTSNCNATTCPLSAALHCMPSYPTTPPPRH